MTLTETPGWTPELVRWYLHGTHEHRLAAVRAAVADVLTDVPGAEVALADALFVVYLDSEAWVYLDHLAATWLALPESAWHRCGEILQDARGYLWDRGVEAL